MHTHAHTCLRRPHVVDFPRYRNKHSDSLAIIQATTGTPVTVQWRTIAEQIVRDTGLDFSIIRRVDSLSAPLHALGSVEGSKPRSVACALVVFAAQQLGLDCDVAGVATAAGVGRGTIQKHVRVLLGAGLGIPPTPAPREGASLQSHCVASSVSGSLMVEGQSLRGRMPGSPEPASEPSRRRVVWRDHCEGASLADVQLIENCLIKSCRGKRVEIAPTRDAVDASCNTTVGGAKREGAPELESCRTNKRRAIALSCDGNDPVSQTEEAVGGLCVAPDAESDGDESLSYGAAVRAVQRRGWGPMHEQAQCCMLSHCTHVTAHWHLECRFEM